MFIASYLLGKVREKGYKQSYAEGYAEGHAEGYAEGHAEGYAEGFAKGYPQGLAKGRAKAYADANKQTAAYFKRMRAALDAGEDFNEPRPKFGHRR